jgi:hypothetical protein
MEITITIIITIILAFFTLSSSVQGCSTLLIERKERERIPLLHHHSIMAPQQMELLINGQLESNQSILSREWGKYFNRLGEESKEYSRNPLFWEELELLELLALPPLSSSEGEEERREGEISFRERQSKNSTIINESMLNDPLTWWECHKVMRTMANGKAPGLDGITIEWLKCALRTIDREERRRRNRKKRKESRSHYHDNSTMIISNNNDNDNNTHSDNGTREYIIKDGFLNKYIDINKYINKNKYSTSDKVSPCNPMAKALWYTLNSMWILERIPEEWEIARIIPILKKGDPTLMDNYRGISLVSVFVKVIMTVISKRLQIFTESNGLLCKGQAGFRLDEECIAQSKALYHILHGRRHQNKEQTFVCFIDFSKAYDRAPHQGLLQKLKSKMRLDNTKVMRLIEATYQNPRFTTIQQSLLTLHPDSDAIFPLLCGVRQGCPSSPILFNMFINDILDGMEPFGVSLPSLLNDDSSRIPGLLFADDLVLLAPNSDSLKSMLKLVDNWCARWKMQVNIEKCGVMMINPEHESSNETILPLSPPPPLIVMIPTIPSTSFPLMARQSPLSKNIVI